MVDSKEGEEIDSTSSDVDIVGKNKNGVEDVTIGEVGEEAEKEQAEKDEGDQQEQRLKVEQEINSSEGDRGVDVVGTDDVVKEGFEEGFDFSGLGSAEDIAAAALQAANISSLFENAEDTRGTKRSHDDMVEEMSTFEGNGTTETSDTSTTQPIATTTTAPLSALESGINSIIASAPAIATNPSIVASNEASNLAAAPLVEADQTEDADDAFLGSLDLEAVAQAAMGLDADGNPLPGNEESHRALADAVKQLSAAQGITLPSTRSGDDESSDNGGNGPAKRFQCTQCERAFARAYNLNTHLATHDPDPSRSKPFPCPYPSCQTDGGRSFSRKHDLQRHVASTHENEPEPITSTIGENGVRHTGALASLGLGTPGRKFRCEDCGRAFVRRDALKRHQCTKIMEASSSNQSLSRPAPDYYTNSAAGLSLYTSNAPSASTSSTQHQLPATVKTTESAESSYDSDPFGSNGITYEHLSKEVQDMAMQLVAQAQSYNEQQTTPSTAKTQQAAVIPQAVAPAAVNSTLQARPLVPQSTISPLSASSLISNTIKSEVKTEAQILMIQPTTTAAASASASAPAFTTANAIEAEKPSSPSPSSLAPTADPISAQ